ncbi:hypothetical protein [Kordia sp.]|uniref:hypothetical protein n=1 Tax=Kordia sp. TaxID=1965332 RepID=UPI003D2B5681
MKRSRDSRYDKKRSRDKKDDKRKLKFSTKSTERKDKNEPTRVSNKDERKKETSVERIPKPEFRNTPTKNTPVYENTPQTPERPLEYEVFSQGDKAYKKRTTHRKKKGGFPKIVWPIAVVAFLFLIRILANIGDSDYDTTSDDFPVEYSPTYKDRSVTTQPPKKREKINAAHFIIGEEKELVEVTQLTKDSIITITPNIQVRLFKGFHVYDSEEFPDVPVLASYSKYHFFYDVKEKVADQSMSEQWSIIREQLAENSYDGYFMYQYPKESNIGDLAINETEFSISTKNNTVYGVATLVEHKNKRYFFQFISKEKRDASPNYNYLRKYINYYLKIKTSYESFDDSDDLNS